MNLRLFISVLMILGVSAGLALGQDDQALKAAQKRIADLERTLAEERRSEEERRSAEMREKQLTVEMKELHQKLNIIEADLRRSKNLGEGETSAIVQLLRAPIATRGLHEKLKLKTALEHFADMFGGKLPILVNREAFAEEFGPDSADPYEEEVSLPPVPSKMLMGTALRLLLSQVGKGQATYIIRGAYIEIVPLKYHTARYFLYEPNIVASFEKRSLADVLQVLGDDSGATIHLDPNLRKGNEIISASFRNSSLEDTLVVVTEMAQLKYVVLERSIFVTSRENAKIVEQEEAARSKQRSSYKRIVPNPAKRLEAASE